MSLLHISLRAATRLWEAAIVLVVSVYFVLGLSLLALRYAVLPNAQQFRPWVEQAATGALGLPVHIGTIQTRWHGLMPQFTLRDVRIDGPHGRPALQFAEVDAAPSWKSLPRLSASFDQLVIRGANLTVLRPDANHLDIGGIRLALDGGGKSDAAQQFADWLFEQDEVLILDSRLTWIDSSRNAPPLPLANVNIALRNTLLTHRAALIATPPAAFGGRVDLRANFRQPLFLRHTADFARWTGTLYGDLPGVDLTALQQQAPVRLPLQIGAGRGSVRAWVQIADLAPTAVTADLALRSLNVQMAALTSSPVSRPQAGPAPSGGSAAAPAASVGATAPPPGRPQAGPAPSGGSAAAPAASVGATVPPPGRPKAEPAPSGGSAAAPAASVGAPSPLPPLALDDFSGRVSWTPLPGGQRIAVQALQFRTAQGPRFGPVDAQWVRQQPENGPAESSLQTGALDLGALSALAQRLPLPGDWHARLSALQPQGRISSLKATWQWPGGADAGGLPPTYSLQTRFSGLAWRSPAGAGADAPPEDVKSLIAAGKAAAGALGLPADLPGVQGLSGTLDATQDGGSVKLALTKGGLDLPLVFAPAQLPFDSLQADLGWQRGSDGTWRVDSKKLTFANADAAGSATLHWRSAPQGLGSMDLQGRLTRADARAVWHYLPVDISLRTRDYLRSSIAAGSAKQVDFTVKGRVADFPYDKPAGGGTFRVTAQIDNGVFNYAPRQLLPKGETARAETVHANALWPELTQVAGDLVVTSHGLEVRNASAHAYGARLTAVNGTLPSFRNGVLSISGKVQAQASDALRYLVDSPINQRLGDVFGSVRASGPVGLDIALRLPLDDMRATTIKGRASLQGVDVVWSSGLPRFAGVRGAVDFSHQGFAVKLDAPDVLGGALALTGGQQQGQALRLQAKGTFTGAGLRAANQGWMQALGRVLHGRAPYSLQITQQPGAGAAGPALDLRSSLVGVAIDLPPPLGKPAAQPDALVYIRTPLPTAADGTPRSAVQIELGGDARAHYTLEEPASPQPGSPAAEPAPSGGAAAPAANVGATAQPPGRPKAGPAPSGGSAAAPAASVGATAPPPGRPKAGPAPSGGSAAAPAASVGAPPPLRVLSGGIAIGPKAALPQPASGVQASVRLPVLDIDAWDAALKRLIDGKSEAPGPALFSAGGDQGVSALLPSTLSLDIGRLTLMHRIVNSVVVGASRSGDLWQANVNSQQMSGYIGWQIGSGNNPGALSARLARLELPRSSDSDVERLLDEQPTSIPALDITADNVDLHGHHFSRLEVQAVNRGRLGGNREWQLTHFQLSSPDAVLSGSGSWTALGAQLTAPGSADSASPARRTAMQFKLAIDDAGGLLATLGKPGLLKGGKGEITGSLAWLGSPLNLDYPSMDGHFKLQLGSGQFLKADPGIAKLLGVLSLQSLPRRLTLDFRDLFSSGFAFDHVDADVAMHNGVASTRDFRMSGVSATVRIEGSANLAAETQNLRVVVIPNINAGAASLAYALVNPVVGLGTFLAQLIAREPLARAFTHVYDITGTWIDPLVKEVSLGATAPAGGGSTPAAP